MKTNARRVPGMWLAAFVAAVGVSPAAPGEPPGSVRREAVVAKGDDLTITAAQLEEKVGSHLFQLRSQEYQIQEQALLEMIGQALMEKEAKARGIGLEELVRTEIDAKAQVTEADRKAAYEGVRGRTGGRPEAEVMAQLEPRLQQQRLQQRRSEFQQELRTKAGVRVLLEPPRLKVDPGDDPSRGPKDAPVTIIEFSDFQCPFCARATATIKRLGERYGGKLRFVFRDFPLPNHPQAPKAAEAASCANEQGKFWEMHDRLFENQGRLQVADLREHAAALGLDTGAFSQCLDSGRHVSEWQKDMADANRYGVNSTPSFFINGRLVSGAQPYEAFARVIEDELERASAARPAKPAQGTNPKKGGQ